MEQPPLCQKKTSRKGQRLTGLTWKKMTSAGPTLHSKADCFQSSRIEKGYKAMAMSVKTRMAYQAALEDNMSTSPTPAHVGGTVRGTRPLPALPQMRCPSLWRSNGPDERPSRELDG